MADLLGLIDIVEGRGAGFLVPVFRAFPGANAQSIQVIDDFDRVAGFEVVEAGGQPFIQAEAERTTDVGQYALWAFRDAAGDVHVETADGLNPVVSGLLESGALSETPLFAAELAEFCRLSLTYPHVLKKAYISLATGNSQAAHVWRDTQILMPAIRRDLARYKRRITPKRPDDDMIVITREHVTEVYTEHPWPRSLPMRETQAMAEIFGVREVVVRPLALARPQRDPGAGDFLFVGVGGVARSIMKESRFRATSMRWGSAASTNGAMALGLTPDWNGGVQPAKPLYLALAQSDLEQIDIVVELAQTAPDGAVQHLINVRPIGHGPYRAGKAELNWLSDRARNFDLIWIIGNHRHRKLRGRPNNLAASSFAGRTARSLIISLLSRHGRLPELEWANGGRRRTPVFALAGTAPWVKGEDTEQTIRRVLHGMLAEEAELHTAANIVVLVPYEVDENARARPISLGNREYWVHLLSRVNPGRSKEAVGWALDVRPSDDDPAAYRNFCVGLLAAYEWDVLAMEEDTVVVGHGGDVLRIWPINDLRRLNSLLRRDAEKGHPVEVIITNQTIGVDMMRRAERHSWTLLHHAQVAAWMSDEFNARSFEDW